MLELDVLSCETTEVYAHDSRTYDCRGQSYYCKLAWNLAKNDGSKKKVNNSLDLANCDARSSQPFGRGVRLQKLSHYKTKASGDSKYYLFTGVAMIHLIDAEEGKLNQTHQKDSVNTEVRHIVACLGGHILYLNDEQGDED